MKSVRSLFACLVIFGLSMSFFFVPSQATFAWGEIGHDTVWALAYTQLSPAAKNAVNDLFSDMAQLPQDMVNVPVYADLVRHTAGWEHTAPYHFADMPKELDYFHSLGARIKSTLDQKKDLSEAGDVGLAILHAEDILRNPNSWKRDSSALQENKETALKFLIHFIGDIHQPLHVGYPEDLGGNDVKDGAVFNGQTVTMTLNGGPALWHGKPMNLHEIWDDVIIGISYATPFGGDNPLPQVAASIYAKILGQPSAANRALWTGNLSPASWAIEYRKYLQASFDSNGVERGVYRSDSNYNLDQYIPLQKPVVDLRLMQAGTRLAAVLNQIFDPNSKPTFAELAFRSQLASLFNSFDNYAPAQGVSVTLEKIIRLKKEPAGAPVTMPGGFE